jgi:hypothetical protein
MIYAIVFLFLCLGAVAYKFQEMAKLYENSRECYKKLAIQNKSLLKLANDRLEKLKDIDQHFIDARVTIDELNATIKTLKDDKKRLLKRIKKIKHIPSK